MLLYQH